MKILITVFVLIMSVSFAYAGGPKPVGEEVIVVSGTTVYTLTKPTAAAGALISILGDDVLWRGYSDNPDALNGHLLDEGDYLFLDSSEQLDGFKVILKSGGSGATVEVLYYGRD